MRSGYRAAAARCVLGEAQFLGGGDRVDRDGDRLGAPATAQSGSLRPLPVTVQTMRWPRSTLPSSAALSRPATEAADAGSTKTPSWEANSR